MSERLTKRVTPAELDRDLLVVGRRGGVPAPSTHPADRLGSRSSRTGLST